MLIIKELLEPFGFSFGQLQDIGTFLQRLQKRSIPITDFIEYVEQEKISRVKFDKFFKERIKKEVWEKIALKCPECKIIMYLYPVNTQPGDQTGDDSKSMWACPKCWHDEYSTKTVKEWFEGG